jgi:hypothetical protein
VIRIAFMGKARRCNKLAMPEKLVNKNSGGGSPQAIEQSGIFGSPLVPWWPP